MLFGWLVPNTLMNSKTSNGNAEKTSVIDAGYIFDQKIKRSRSKVLNLYSRLIHRSSSKNILKIKTLLGELQHELITRREYRLDLPEMFLDQDSIEQIECVEAELLAFTRKWMSISKQHFEFMNFLVDLERIGDSIRFLFDCEDEQLQLLQLAEAI